MASTDGTATTGGCRTSLRRRTGRMVRKACRRLRAQQQSRSRPPRKRHRSMRAVLAIAVALVTVGFTSSDLPRFRLAATDKAPRAGGWVQMAPSVSPFSVAVSRDGKLICDLDITVHDLPPVSYLGAYAGYQAWLATPNLDVVRRLGAVRKDSTLHVDAGWN